jgi:hypothetical protein
LRHLSTLPKPEGSLVAQDFADLILALSSCQWTGSLILTNGGVGKNVLVQDGRLVFASSTSVDDRLGELLLRQGRITWRQLVDAGNAIAPGKRLGTILVEMGILTPKDLIRVVIEHTQEIIYSLFQWTEGRYRLQAEWDAAEAITLRMSTPSIIMEGIRRIDSWSRIQRGVGGIEGRYRRSDRYEDVIGEMSLSAEQVSLLAELRGTPTVEEVCARSPLPDFETCRCLWAYRIIGAVVSLDKRPAVEALAVDDDGLGSILVGEDQ